MPEHSPYCGLLRLCKRHGSGLPLASADDHKTAAPGAARRAAISKTAFAQPAKFPSGRVTIVVPFPAGAATDISARIYAERLSALWGQPVVIDNKGGGNGIPAAEVGGARQAGRAHALRHLGDDPGGQSRALRQAALRSGRGLRADHAHGHLALRRCWSTRTARSRRAAELTAKLKAEPGKHNFGAGALPARVASELYKLAAGVDAVYVGYKSNPQAIPDLQSGLLTFMMIDTVNAKIADRPRRAEGPAASPTAERYAALPDMPTAAEAGLPDVLLTTWTGFYAPKGTPREIVDKINRRHRAAVRGPAGGAGAA